MSRVSFSQRCIFCGTENRKRSKHAIFFRCRKCGEVNAGPGMSKAHAQALTIAMTPVQRTNERKKVSSPAPELVVPAPAASATVIKAARASTQPTPPTPPERPASRPAPVKTSTPKAPATPPAQPKRSILERLAYG